MAGVVFTAFAAPLIEIVRSRNIQQIAQGEWIIQGQRQSTLVTASAFGAGIVQRRAKTPHFFLLPAYLDIAFSRLLTGQDLHMRFYGRQALKVFQPLFNITQIQQFALTWRERAVKLDIAIAVRGEPDLADVARHYYQRQNAAF